MVMSSHFAMVLPSKADKVAKVATVSGTVLLDTSWERRVYLSHIPSFDKRFEIASQMIIAEAPLDSVGNFILELDFLPKLDQLYRLHIVKKGDSPASLIIGGQNENHLLLVLDATSQVILRNDTILPPFKNVLFNQNRKNESFSRLIKSYSELDFKASTSNAYTRKLINDQLKAKLLITADSSSFVLTSLFAVYLHRNLSSADDENYAMIVNKWKDSDSPYLNEFSVFQAKDRPYFGYLSVLGFGIVLVTAWFFIIRKHKKSALNELSVQERKVFSFLKEGKTNQEISDECSIAVSTVKSHVSSIYGKLNITSRKDAMNFDE